MRVTDDDAALLERAAAKEGRSPSELLHEAIVDYTSGWRRRRDQLLDDILEHDAKLLRKLGHDVTLYLEVDDLLHVAERLTGKQVVARDAGQLAAAAARPKATVRGVDVYLSTAEKAAALLVSLTTSKGLHDGNKRLAWVATRLFCAANGAPLGVDDEQALKVLRAVALGDLDVPDLAQWLGGWMTPAVVPDP